MDTTEDSKPIAYSSLAHLHPLTLPANTTDDASKEEDLPKGSSILTVPIPSSLSDPSRPTLDSAQDCDLRNLCFHLGLCSDIVGFTDSGDLKFAFDPLPPHWLSKNQGLTVSW